MSLPRSKEPLNKPSHRRRPVSSTLISLDSGVRRNDDSILDQRLPKRFASMHFGTVEIEPADFRTAAVLIESPAALRAGDALHLAVARRLGAPLASIDRRLCAATDALGLARVDLMQEKHG